MWAGSGACLWGVIRACDDDVLKISICVGNCLKLCVRWLENYRIVCGMAWNYVLDGLKTVELCVAWLENCRFLCGMAPELACAGFSVPATIGSTLATTLGQMAPPRSGPGACLCGVFRAGDDKVFPLFQGYSQHLRQGSGFMVQGSGFRVQGSGCRVQGSGFRVQGARNANPQRFRGATQKTQWLRGVTHKNVTVVDTTHKSTTVQGRDTRDCDGACATHNSQHVR